jgi:hypothetical protein
MQPQFGEMLGQKSLGTESLHGISSSLSGQAPQHHNLTISTGESEDQPGGAAMIACLQQENLIKQQWLVLFAAVVMDRTLCHGDNDRSACEMMCGFIPNMAWRMQILLWTDGNVSGDTRS